MDHLDISVLAVLLAEACNIGFSPVSKEGIESLKYDRLMYVNHQYIRLDTLSAANKKIISAYKKLPTSLVWGTNQMASADGIRYTTPQRSLYSRSNPQYFGRGRGITFYNFVSDQYIGFHGMVVPGTLWDSLYLLDGFLNQTSGLEPKQIMTDTAGYSDLVFGLFGLLGFQFSPRIANNYGTRLWRIDLTADYKMLNEVSQNKINTTRIEKNWSEILRVAGSLKSGKVNATESTKALQRNGQPTELGKAIIEYGKVYKTKQVAQFTLWTTSSHIVSSLTHNRTHNTVHLMLIRCYKDSCLSIRILIKSLIHQNTGTLHLCNLVLLSHARSRYTPSSQKKCSNS